ncbi:4-hydroxy-4-methyl-2-oxoglutarate aldolase [Variibacter gotjawalensis]|uniref:Putative 4-hydroxy-4-methyl-2-oxoglutarate aldolase n=1 Tax=Variibacter gotjawalensis TaxID=1333996 RepID=A0A0S3PR24_9BRAD|nr:aldolase [Variibacter gotjawalensis]NIK48716.1 4-hydroxy-4-methyl-2-oxoglutarate aldolase [Variibacter gotjawalensis]RZS50577.1 4-carboxy-4-hydroxy-2-oxoadipate aldolase [Variibacter gotjawalensis]BAT58411.1 4-hydroxy-4-methyl-2-oxoglutarate aldolase [Variibacter gotjawalensis]
MIEEAPLLTVKRNFKRPADEIVAAFKGVMLGNICDAMGGVGAMDYRIKACSGLPDTFVGVALPCYCGPGDNLAVSAAVALAKAGDVIVAAADGFTGTGIIGDQIVGMMKNRGIAAFVTDGVARDLADLRKIGLPVCAKGVTPNSVHRSGPGTVGLPVTCGGVRVEAGDIVVGDVDGVAVIPQAIAAEVLEKVKAIRELEKGLWAKVVGGLDAPPFGVATLEGGRVKFVD